LGFWINLRLSALVTWESTWMPQVVLQSSFPPVVVTNIQTFIFQVLQWNWIGGMFLYILHNYFDGQVHQRGVRLRARSEGCCPLPNLVHNEGNFGAQWRGSSLANRSPSTPPPPQPPSSTSRFMTSKQHSSRRTTPTMVEEEKRCGHFYKASNI
jgi:hypothetical protein